MCARIHSWNLHILVILWMCMFSHVWSQNDTVVTVNMVGYKEIESEEEFEEALEEAGDRLVIADFWATWCGPCRMIGPHFEKLAGDDKYDAVIFLKIDVDEVGELAEQHGIAVMPTFICFKNGEKVDEMSGANRDMLTQMIEKHMN